MNAHIVGDLQACSSDRRNPKVYFCYSFALFSHIFFTLPALFFGVYAFVFHLYWRKNWYLHILTFLIHTDDNYCSPTDMTNRSNRNKDPSVSPSVNSTIKWRICVIRSFTANPQTLKDFSACQHYVVKAAICYFKENCFSEWVLWIYLALLCWKK